MMSTHQKILALMAGYESSKPMPFDVLVEKTGLQPGTLENVLGAMLRNSPPLINSATVTRAGVSQEVYWPIGIVDHRKAIPISINPAKSIEGGFSGHRHPPRRTEAQQPASPPGSNGSENKTTSTEPTGSIEKVQPDTTKEQTMNTASKRIGSQPSKLTQTIYDKIVEHPGVKQTDLIKHALKECPEATEKQAKKAIANLTNASKKIRSEGKGEDRAFHLTVGVSTVKTNPKAPRKSAVGKVVTGKEAKALRGKTKFSSKPKKAMLAAIDRSFGCLIDDEDHLHLILGENKMILNPVHVQRLGSFLQRIGSRA